MTELLNVLITDNSTFKTNYQWSKHPIIVSFLRQIYVLWDTFNLRCQPYQTFLEASLLCNIKLLCSVLRNHEGWTPFQSWFFFCMVKLVKSKKGHWTMDILELRRDLRPNTIIWYHCPGRFDSIVRTTMVSIVRPGINQVV